METICVSDLLLQNNKYRDLINAPQYNVKLRKMHGEQTIPFEIHPTEDQLVYVVEGVFQVSTTYETGIASMTVQLCKKSLIQIPAGTRHQIQCISPEGKFMSFYIKVG
jgi:quercetin dioxygenase-like cupin family protein